MTPNSNVVTMVNYSKMFMKPAVGKKLSHESEEYNNNNRGIYLKTHI